MQSTGHSSTQARSFKSTHGCAITYVTVAPWLPNRRRPLCGPACCPIISSLDSALEGTQPEYALPGWLGLSEPLGEWTLRAARGFTWRANSCLAVGDPGMPAGAAAAKIVAFSRAHGIPPRAE